MSDQWTTKLIDKYVIVNKKLGQGVYGTVYNGFVQGNEAKKVAVKTIPIKVLEASPKMMLQLKREVAILTKINNPYIVRLYDVSRTSNFLYMFLEYCPDGDLRDFLAMKEEKRLSELEAALFLKHVTEGFRHLHQLKVIHRDIKPANILLKNGVAKITDFGFARMIESEMNDPTAMSRLGSPLYMSPQVLEGLPFSAKCDVWSVGIMFYELLYGRPPWIAENQYNLAQNIKTQPLSFPSKPVRSQKVKHLLQQMLATNERDRISWEGIFQDPIIQMDEFKIKQNMQAMLMEKDDFSRSISMNRIYMEQNLVVGYLTQAPLQQPDEDSVKETQSSDSDDQPSSDSFLTKLRREKLKRDAFLKLNTYFLFERNLALFFNYVVQRIISSYQANKLGLQVDWYFRLIYLITKNQIIHLDRIHKRLKQKHHENFDVETWGKYLASQECRDVSVVIQNDLSHTNEFFNVVAKKTMEVQRAIAVQNPLAQRFVDQAGGYSFETSETFQLLYSDVLRQTILTISQTECLQLVVCLLICLSPYAQFRDIGMDFNCFYEGFEQLSLVELTEWAQRMKDVLKI